ncbi:MAG TPA: NAD(P)-dependent oxidoreductase [Tahibacter sp.]|uniref:NAD-dependent epimerase/dehydratase family protein n=1 Tax=Tahibacter sp. TaxID=2056211 RepID=UPI002C1706DC|nr:NAD(P)-dependent oxidoreductase [Tahibacter sp.]HSX62109.1 NAD(P)-dependent oxidoreductase [Tahibacter sp.]
MRIVVTGSSGHLGEALMRSLRASGDEAIGLDRLASPFTDRIGSLVDAGFVHDTLAGADAVLHTATLHKPHVATHTRQEFVDSNVTGTLNVLEACVAHRVKSLVFTSTTSAFGAALTPPPGEPAAWIDETVRHVPKNIYGVTKIAAEDLCELFHRRERLPCLILRTSRFFPEADDSAEIRDAYDDANAKVNELLYRRVDIADVVSAHRCALDRAPAIGFDRYIISAATPLSPDDAAALRRDAPGVIARYFPDYVEEYARRGWRMFPEFDRIYSSAKAVRELGWRPAFGFGEALAALRDQRDYRSDLTLQIGRKGYHADTFAHGPYPV